MMAGTPRRRVQEWLGHSTITMTMHYSHLSPSETELGNRFLAAVDAISAESGGALVS